MKNRNDNEFKIRIAYLISSLNTGGVQKLVFDIIKKINKAQFKIYLIFWRRGAFYYKFKKIYGLNLIQLKYKPRNINAPNILKSIGIIKHHKELKELVKREKIDIIHSHMPYPDLQNFLLKIKFKDVKIISTKHDMLKIRKKVIYRIINKIINSKFDTIICCSNNVKKYLQKYEFSPNIKTIKNGVNIDEIIRAPKIFYNFINKENFNIISVGRLDKVKGFNHLIRSFKIFNTKIPKSNLFICGEGSERNNLEKLINRFQLDKKCFLLGNRDDVYSLLKNCDLFVLLSNSEGLPISILEAMTCKIPVIGSNIFAIKDIIKNGVNGYLVNRYEYKKIAHLMIKLKNSKITRKKFKAEGFKTVKERYDINDIVKLYEREYFKLININ